jgi:hypothetical protein
MLAQLVIKLKRAESSRAELATSRASSRATSILSSPTRYRRFRIHCDASEAGSWTTVQQSRCFWSDVASLSINLGRGHARTHVCVPAQDSTHQFSGIPGLLWELSSALSSSFESYAATETERTPTTTSIFNHTRTSGVPSGALQWLKAEDNNYVNGMT